jgi:hypothetical protein
VRGAGLGGELAVVRRELDLALAAKARVLDLELAGSGAEQRRVRGHVQAALPDLQADLLGALSRILGGRCGRCGRLGSAGVDAPGPDAEAERCAAEERQGQ